MKGRHVGECKSCGRVIGWFAFIRYDALSETDAIIAIARLAGVSVGPDGRLIEEWLPWTPPLDPLASLFTSINHKPVG